MLFGPENMAYKMGYTEKQQIVTEEDVKQVLDKRKNVYFHINQMIDMRRDDLINSTLVSECPTKESREFGVVF
jgi:hypothetical protein